MTPETDMGILEKKTVQFEGRDREKSIYHSFIIVYYSQYSIVHTSPVQHGKNKMDRCNQKDGKEEEAGTSPSLNCASLYL